MDPVIDMIFISGDLGGQQCSGPQIVPDRGMQYPCINGNASCSHKSFLTCTVMTTSMVKSMMLGHLKV